MAWNKSGGRANIIISLLVLIILILLWSQFSAKILQYFSKSAVYENEPGDKKTTGIENIPSWPAGFATDNLVKKDTDINHNGKKEIFLVSFAASRASAILVDASETTKALSNIFDFSTAGYPEAEFKSDEAPEVSQVLDLDGDGIDEIVLDLKSYGAYSSLFGVISIKGGKISWVKLKDENGDRHLGIFEDGASVRNATIFKVLDSEKPPALVQIFGGSQDGTNWFWNADAYQWNGSIFTRVKELSDKIVSEQPKRIVNGDPVFQ